MLGFYFWAKWKSSRTIHQTLKPGARLPWRNPSNFASHAPGRAIYVLLGVKAAVAAKPNPLRDRDGKPGFSILRSALLLDLSAA
jgi:hypothetical protein